MTVAFCQKLALILFVLFSSYGLFMTLRLPRIVALKFDFQGRPYVLGSRWTLFSIVEFVQALGTYMQLTGPSPRPEAAIRASAAGGIIVMCYVAYLQHLMFEAARDKNQILSRRRFWIASAALAAGAIAVNLGAGNLP